MEYYFTVSQIARMAMGIEEAGAQFYTMLAEAAPDNKIKEIFLFLAEYELQHKEAFNSIALSAAAGEKEFEYSIDIASCVLDIINKVKDKAFRPSRIGQKPIDISKALDIAIYTETASIRIYSEVAKNFISRFHDIIKKILEEERSHLKMLCDVRSKSGK